MIANILHNFKLVYIKFNPLVYVLKYNWDASTYDSISDIIESWGLNLIQRINWKGKKIILFS
jgi:hypothetical protein